MTPSRRATGERVILEFLMLESPRSIISRYDNQSKIFTIAV